MGELLNGTSTTEIRSVTETHTATPRLSAGMSTLVNNPGETQPPAPPAPDPGVVRASLLVADAVLTAGGFLLVLKQTGPDTISTLLALLALLFGGWLGWLGLTWGRPVR